MRFLINCSNLHNGGGVQVAASFISMIPEGLRPKLSIILSSEVFENLQISELEINQFAEFHIVNVYGFFLNKKLNKLLRNSDRVFTVFGPLYQWSANYTSIVGFAQAWILYPSNECYCRLSFTKKILTRLKFWIHSQYFKRADIIIVELEHVKNELIPKLGINPNQIFIVKNCISSVFFDERAWESVNIKSEDGYLKLGFIGRNYLHKNTEIFSNIISELQDKYALKALFFVTFTDKEWNECSTQFKEVCINVGPLRINQCPSFYQCMDGIVFPSLLECFSATPLEAMYMEKPLFASDRKFNRDICGQYAHYFDPISPTSAAQVIASVFKNNSNCHKAGNFRAAREHAIHFSSPQDRLKKYLSLLLD
ncbi:MAG: glycosyltransferase family 4 protein [Candidatus Electronema sp. VV]